MSSTIDPPGANRLSAVDLPLFMAPTNATFVRRGWEGGAPGGAGVRWPVAACVAYEARPGAPPGDPGARTRTPATPPLRAWGGSPNAPFATDRPTDATRAVRHASHPAAVSVMQGLPSYRA